ncbi:hypothetical protein [Promicromonospora sp. NFX87]|uniref:hypothetical protein n=1 Tax=Promicromonospora sp. NFX87 TaxID=3402691 RepID=UPI003AFAFD88
MKSLTASLIADYANHMASRTAERTATAADVRYVADAAGLTPTGEPVYTQEDATFLLATIRSQIENGVLPDTTTDR